MKRLRKKIRVKKHKKIIAKNSGPLLTAFLQRAYDTLPENVKQRMLYMQSSKAQKEEARKLGYKPYGEEVSKMGPEEYKIPEETQQILRESLAKTLEILRVEQSAAGRSRVGRALSIAITDFEKVSMVVIRSFFADKPYSPLQLLQPKTE